jgi:hypothetical protein
MRASSPPPTTVFVPYLELLQGDRFTDDTSEHLAFETAKLSIVVESALKPGLNLLAHRALVLSCNGF